jgi:hypothetical protein
VNKNTSIALKKSFFITLGYVGLGTTALLSMNLTYGGEFVSDLTTIILFLTIPVTCIGFAIMYSEPHGYGVVLIVQSIVFLLFWLIVFLIINKRLKKKLSSIMSD